MAHQRPRSPLSPACSMCGHDSATGNGQPRRHRLRLARSRRAAGIHFLQHCRWRAFRRGSRSPNLREALPAMPPGRQRRHWAEPQTQTSQLFSHQNPNPHGQGQDAAIHPQPDQSRRPPAARRLSANFARCTPRTPTCRGETQVSRLAAAIRAGSTLDDATARRLSIDLLPKQCYPSRRSSSSAQAVRG